MKLCPYKMKIFNKWHNQQDIKKGAGESIISFDRFGFGKVFGTFVLSVMLSTMP